MERQIARQSQIDDSMVMEGSHVTVGDRKEVVEGCYLEAECWPVEVAGQHDVMVAEYCSRYEFPAHFEQPPNSDRRALWLTLAQCPDHWSMHVWVTQD